MRKSKGIFYNQLCQMGGVDNDWMWEGVMRGLVKEAGDYYYYEFEVKDSKGAKQTYFIPISN